MTAALGLAFGAIGSTRQLAAAVRDSSGAAVGGGVGNGLVLGGLLALGRLSGGATGAVATTLIGLMRAAPTFVVMFFLLNIIPRDATLFGIGVAPSGIMIVALSLVPYSASYVADNGAEALRQLRAGSPLGALQFLPNVTRAFFVLVMSSSAGAAIGVTEGIAVILREAVLLPSLGGKLVVFAIGAIFWWAVASGQFDACSGTRPELVGALALMLRSGWLHAHSSLEHRDGDLVSLVPHIELRPHRLDRIAAASDAERAFGILIDAK